MIRDVFALGVQLLCGCHARWQRELVGDRPRLFFANHTSHLDAVVVWSALPAAQRRACRIIAAADYWGGGPVRRWLATRGFRAILIERKRVTRRNNPLAAMKECLESGESLILFPEGTRGEGGAIQAFRSGMWHIARAVPKVELVPVWIENLSRVLPKGEFLPAPVLVAVSFGAPLARVDDEPKDAFLERARQAILELQRERHA